ncbi:MAG: DUF2911 domain-containing protein [Saprospiraceae bacterium]|nr:DUF2911 domain-containing protein [Saprospiraceae bacterium]
MATKKSAPWRAGANENTVIEFSHEAKVAGKTVPAGRYGLFFVINKDDSGEVVLSKDSRSWGSFFYEPTQDQLRVKIQLRSIPMTEMLTFDFINLTKNSAELVLNWEKKQFPVAIEFAVDDRAGQCRRRTERAGWIQLAGICFCGQLFHAEQSETRKGTRMG